MDKLKNSGIAQVFRSKGTVFTPTDLSAIWGITNSGYLKSRIEYYLKKGYLYRICHGLYVKDKDDFNILEVANKLRSPSYISLETVLAAEGIIFQKYSAVFLVSYTTKTIKVPAGEFVYKKIKDQILFNPEGITNEGAYSIASKERAFLDAVYLYKDYHFDNLRPIDWDKVDKLSKIYQSSALIRRVREYKNDIRPE